MKNLLLILSLTLISFGSFAQVNCFDVIIDEVIRDPFEEDFIIVQIENPQFQSIPYPGVRIYDAETDILLGEEVVNFFGIAEFSNHQIPIELDVLPSEIYSLRIEIWSNFYESLECTFTGNYTLYPTEFCTDPEFFISSNTQGVSEQFILDVSADGETVFTDTFTLSDEQAFYFNDSICLPSGCYQAQLSTLDATISMDGLILLEAGPYIGVPGLNFEMGQAVFNFEFTIFDCLSNGIEDFADADGFRIFPNPVSNDLYISSDREDQAKAWSLLDLSGKVIDQGSKRFSNLTLDVSDLSPGLYLLRLDFGGQLITKRFVKE